MRGKVSINSKKDKHSLLLATVLVQLVSQSLCSNLSVRDQASKIFGHFDIGPTTVKAKMAKFIKPQSNMFYKFCSFDWQTKITEQEVNSLAEKVTNINYNGLTIPYKFLAGLKSAGLNGEITRIRFTPLWYFFEDKPSFFTASVLIAKKDKHTKLVEYLKMVVSYEFQFNPQFQIYQYEECYDNSIWEQAPGGLILSMINPGLFEGCTVTEETKKTGYREEQKDELSEQFQNMALDQLKGVVQQGDNGYGLLDGLDQSCADIPIMAQMPM